MSRSESDAVERLRQFKRNNPEMTTVPVADLRELLALHDENADFYKLLALHDEAVRVMRGLEDACRRHSRWSEEWLDYNAPERVAVRAFLAKHEEGK